MYTLNKTIHVYTNTWSVKTDLCIYKCNPHYNLSLLFYLVLSYWFIVCFFPPYSSIAHYNCQQREVNNYMPTLEETRFTLRLGELSLEPEQQHFKGYIISGKLSKIVTVACYVGVINVPPCCEEGRRDKQ